MKIIVFICVSYAQEDMNEIFKIIFLFYATHCMFPGTYPLYMNLTHWVLMTTIWANWLYHHWFRWWLVTYQLPNHYLNQWGFIMIWTLKSKLESLVKIKKKNPSKNCLWKCKMAACFLSIGIKLSLKAGYLDGLSSRLSGISLASSWGHLANSCVDHCIHVSWWLKDH